MQKWNYVLTDGAQVGPIDVPPEEYAQILKANNLPGIESSTAVLAPADQTTSTDTGCCGGNDEMTDLLLEIPAAARGLTLRDPDTGDDVTTKIAQEVGDLLDAGWIPIRPDGEPYHLYSLLGGTLFDGTPLNVIFGQGWIETQKEILTPLIEAGEIPVPLRWDSPDTISLNALPLGARTAGFSGPAALLGIGALWFFTRKKKGGRR